LVRRKAAGKAIEAPEEEAAESNVINLMDALKQSLSRKKSGTPPIKGKKRTSARRGRKRRVA
jgi:non-homologous end joining protein Ku